MTIIRMALMAWMAGTAAHAARPQTKITVYLRDWARTKPWVGVDAKAWASQMFAWIGIAVQWGIGLVVDAARSKFGIDTGAALQLAFTLVLIVDFLACGWFLFGWRRHAVVTPAVDASA